MEQGLDLFKELGGEAGCKTLARAFYGRVAGDSLLRPLFPGKSLRCATEEFSAFLVQFFDGDEDRTQYRWWLSLRESHARFEISEAQRSAWIGQMRESLSEIVSNTRARVALQDFFLRTSLYLIGQEPESSLISELAERWDRQLAVDQLIEHLLNGRDIQAICLAKEQSSRRGVFVGILARMLDLNREQLDQFVLLSVQEDGDLPEHRFNGRTLLHFAAGAACLPVVRHLLAVGVAPDILDGGGHTPLYRVAGSRRHDQGASIVEELVRAGATVDHCGGLTRSTALHQAARHGDLAVAEALLDRGACPTAKDSKGLTPLDRAVNCRRHDVAALLASRS